MPGWLARAQRAVGRGTRGRAARLSLATGLVGLALVAVPGNASTDACPTAIQHFADGWEQIALPPGFVTVQHALQDYALDTGTTNHLLATNGTDIVRSLDGGCTWQQSNLPQSVTVPDVTGDNTSVVRRSITQVRSTPYRGLSWAIGSVDVELNNTPLTQPAVYTSSDAGLHFASATNGLPATGQPLDLETVAGSPVAFLLFRQLAGTGQEMYSIYETTNAGTNWTQAFTGLPQFRGMTVGLGGNGLSIWAWTDSALYRSTGGAAFAAVPGVSGPVRTVDLSPGLISVFHTSGGERLVSTNGGSSWHSLPAPQNVKSATHGPLVGLLAVSGDLPNVEVDPPASSNRKPFDASPIETNLENLQMSMGIESYGFLLYGANSNTIFRFKVPASFLYKLPPLPAPVAANPVHVKARPPMLRTPELSPNIPTVTLRPHQHRNIPYRLLLPPTPTPLDVYFMTDSTSSMADTIGSVQDSIQQIVDDLAASGIDVHFGVADFRDYPMQEGLVATDDWAYRRDRAIGPVNDAFARALQSIQTGGGTLDSRDSGLEAIYQAATGAGRKVVSDPSGASDIQPGLGAEFRPNAVKVIVVAADAEFRHPESNPAWPGPSRDLVATTLAQSGIHLVGLDVDTGSGQDPGPDMQALAAASHTTAGPAGVDCDGDGVPDLRAGDALVCRYAADSHESIAPAFLGLLDSLRDLKTVSLGVQGPRDVVRPLGATTFPQVNVKAVNRLGVPLEFRCDPPRFGSTTTVRVVAAVAAQQVASLPVTVKCGTPAAPPPPVQPLFELPALAAVAVAPPAPPAQPNPNPNPNPQTQTNPGAASQEDQAQQLAFAEQGLLPDDEPGMAMSALRPQSRVGVSAAHGSDERAAAYLLAAGSLLAFGAACRTRVARRWSWERNPS
ncbi:MAG: hypothetical protein QOC82_2204 [Frankiaceae bacterium]|nr:hypothetical protein [Frankiaceae bacterium]